MDQIAGGVVSHAHYLLDDWANANIVWRQAARLWARLWGIAPSWRELLPGSGQWNTAKCREKEWWERGWESGDDPRSVGNLLDNFLHLKSRSASFRRRFKVPTAHELSELLAAYFPVGSAKIVAW